MKRFMYCPVFLFAFLVLYSVQPAAAKEFTVFGNPLNLFGYASQTAQISLKGDHYHVEEGLQQALLTVFAEADYMARRDLKFYISGLFTMDLIYDIKHDDDSWNKKLFSQSRSRMYLDDRSWQFLKECHITWSPGDFLLRVGKQIVSWGEMDFFQLMDQINPIDQRRGFSDVEFESTVIPIWLVRGEWWPQVSFGWVEELGIQFTFNPNAQFITNQAPNTGNDYAGIWSVGLEVPSPLFEFGLGTPTLYFGAPDLNGVLEPEKWNDEGFEYALRLSLIMKGSILTLNGFYGRQNSPQVLLTGFAEDPLLTLLFGESVPALGTASDGTSIVNPIYSGSYPIQKFVGVTWTGDLPGRVAFLGGVNPLMRIEIRYQFDKLFTDGLQENYLESDLFDVGVGIDWKVKIPALNQLAYFSVLPQIFYQRVIDYPDQGGVFDTDLGLISHQDNVSLTLALSTSYFSGKLVPLVAGAYQINTESHLILTELAYLYSSHWNFTVGASFLGGQIPNDGFWPFRKNDYMFFKVQYNWG